MKSPNIIELKNIANNITKCPFQCQLVENDFKSGVIPRCIFIEVQTDAVSGSIVIGINPGKANAHEKNYYKAHQGSLTHDTIQQYWMKYIKTKNAGFYEKINIIMKGLKIESIYWTEVAKCENIKYELSPEEQVTYNNTLSYCGNKYLKKELMQIPTSWPIFAISKAAFDFCETNFGDRKIIGIPHPTSKHTKNKFNSLLENEYTTKPEVLDKIKEFLTSDSLVLNMLNGKC